MDMKRHMLICFFISMFVGKEKKRSVVVNKMEIVIRKVNMKRDFFFKIKKMRELKA
jgi:hypothetical protein